MATVLATMNTPSKCLANATHSIAFSTFPDLPDPVPEPSLRPLGVQEQLNRGGKGADPLGEALQRSVDAYQERHANARGKRPPRGIGNRLLTLLGEADRSSFPRSPWECRPCRSAALREPRRRRASRTTFPRGPWERVQCLSSSRVAAILCRVRRGVSDFSILSPELPCKKRRCLWSRSGNTRTIGDVAEATHEPQLFPASRCPNGTDTE
jgi:hypothetical protein